MTKKIAPTTSHTALARQNFFNEKNLDSQAIYHSGPATASYFDSDSQVRPSYGRDSYEKWRPNEAIPRGRTQEELRSIMEACIEVYKRVGIVRSVVDLMSEFAAEGIEIVHEDEGPNNFYKAWFKRIKGADRAERFASWALKGGNVVVRRNYGTLNTSKIQEMKRGANAVASAGRIPLDYKFYNPSTIELVGGFLGTISDERLFALRVPMASLSVLRTPRNDLEKRVYNALPQEVKDALTNNLYKGTYYVPFKEDEVYVSYYKKDDTDIWATSFIYSILSDIYYNDKLKLAKTSALDSFINVIRIWKMGKVEKDIMPAPGAGAKLANMIGSKNVGGGGIDIIWTDDLECQELYPPVENLAGLEENYNSILLGLGVPESLVGGNADSKQNAATGLGLKNLISRIECVRRMLIDWLNSEIDIIQKAMGFRTRPYIRFAYNNLHDEQTYYKLLADLVDRNVISDERILEILKEIPQVEQMRIKKEENMRKSGDMPPKASPFHSPDLPAQQTHEIKKIDKQAKVDKELAGSPGMNSNNLQKKKTKNTKKGRPPGSKDTVRRVKKASISSYILEGGRIYGQIDELVTGILLDQFGVANVRLLTAKQKVDLEASKDLIFPHVAPFSTVNDDLLLSAYEMQDGPAQEFKELYNESLQGLAIDKITVEQKRLLKISAYAEAWYNFVNNNEEDENNENIST